MATEKKAKASTAKKKKSTSANAAAKKKRVILTFQADPGCEIFVAGSFNDWDPTKKQMKEKNEGSYEAIMMLEPGEYEYKIVKNGRWQSNPNSENWAPNPFGSLNSVLKVDA